MKKLLAAVAAISLATAAIAIGSFGDFTMGVIMVAIGLVLVIVTSFA